MCLQGGANQPRNTIAEREQVRLEAVGVAVEHGAEVFDGSALRAGHNASGRCKMPNIGILGSELQRVGVCFGSFVMTPKT